ncbi:hypothetical protein N9E11_00975 [Crocinitomicaceae bacterium]|nr:hypothetical protein [Crocinitomicaceae bacterium]
MRKSILLLLLVTSSLLISCSSTSKEELEKDVKASIIEQNTDPSISVNDVSLINTEGDTYEGFVNTTESGEEVQYNLTVKVDGDEFIWELN